MKRALVTGGSGDLGKAICIDLAKNNIEVLVHSNTKNPFKFTSITLCH
jgi:3-oxoacyl-[acyl-carrier protein] reductase